MCVCAPLCVQCAHGNIRFESLRATKDLVTIIIIIYQYKTFFSLLLLLLKLVHMNNNEHVAAYTVLFFFHRIQRRAHIFSLHSRLQTTQTSTSVSSPSVSRSKMDSAYVARSHAIASYMYTTKSYIIIYIDHVRRCFENCNVYKLHILLLLLLSLY